MRRLTLTSLLVSFLAVTALGACKSGVGERCQVDFDCEDGLVCGSQSSTCQEDIESNNDASVDAAQDGPETDAALPIDAEVDAPTDAPTDATPDA
jgi:hypothetical protein